MDMRSTSVIVVSHGRPQSLLRCLNSLSRLHYSNYEIIVVANKEALHALAALSFANHLKTICCDVANISVARNAGLAAAQGDVVAFLDDDAVAEPNWLFHIDRAFVDLGVQAVGGFVIGRNGISYENTVNVVDHFGMTQVFECALQDHGIPEIPAGSALKTEGTNMAFDREVLLNLSGFDTGFSYFLDDTDINMRLQIAGCKTAIAPHAVVHHKTGENRSRSRNNTPTSLFEIGRSYRHYLNKYCPPNQQGHAVDIIHDTHRQRLLRHMIAGRIEPFRVSSLLDELHDGLANAPNPHDAVCAEPQNFQPFPTIPCFKHSCFSGNRSSLKQQHDAIRHAMDQGHTVTVFDFSKSTLFHNVDFTPHGVWLHKGGLWGKSLRCDPLFKYYSREQRVLRERTLLHPRRDVLI